MMICITGTGYFGASRQRVKQLAKSLDIQYSGELIKGITNVLVVADDPNTPSAELLDRQKATTARVWGNIKVVSNQWLEDSAQRGALCDPTEYTLLPQEEVPVTNAVTAARTLEQNVRLQMETTGLEGDNVASRTGTCTDSPELLRNFDQPLHFAACESDINSGSPIMSNSRQTGKPSQSPHDGGSNPNLLVHTTDINLDDTQAVPPLEADTPELSQHIGSSTLLPQPLQLLCDNNRRRSTRAKHVLAGDAVSEASPQAVRVVAGHRLKRAPKPSTAASFHGVPASRIAYYDTLTVEHPELDAPLEFCVHDPPHCALVHYDESMDGETRDLAYAQIMYCYRLARDDRLYIEHKYLYDADDIRQQRAGSAFLEQHSMADKELVHSSEVYHSPAEVIDGEFWLVDRVVAEKATQAARDSNASRADLHLFCEHSWDRLTGSLLPLVT